MLSSNTLGQGPNLVMLHGWGMNSAIWEDIVLALAADFQVTLIDLPGHGDSSWTGSALDLNAWVAECVAAAPTSAIWVGWSLGGTIALAAALTTPQLIRAVVMVTATPRFLRSEHWPHGLQPDILGRFQDTLQTDWNETLGQFLDPTGTRQ